MITLIRNITKEVKTQRITVRVGKANTKVVC
jgi:hypothetical protein